MNRYEMPNCNELIIDFEKLLSTVLGEPVKIMLRYEQYHIGLDEIKVMVCEAFNLPWEKVIQDCRKRELIYARMSFAYLAKRFTSITDGNIGAYIGKDRCTVINNHQTISHLMFVQDLNVYPYLKSIIEMIETVKTPLNEN